MPLGMGLLFLLNVLAARLLGPRGFGTFSLVIAASSILTLLVCIGVPAATMRFVAQYKACEDWAMVNAVLRWSRRRMFVSVAGVEAILLVFIMPFLGHEARKIVGLIAIVVPPAALWLWQRFVALGLDLNIMALLPRDVLLPSLSCAALLTGIASSATSLLLIYSVLFLAIEVIATKHTLSIIPPAEGIRDRSQHHRKWSATAFPMALTSITQLGMNRWDVIFLGLFTSLQQLGIYNAAARLSLLTSPVARVVSTFAAPLMASAINNNHASDTNFVYRRMYVITLLLGLPICAIVIIFPSALLSMIYGPLYSGAATSLRILGVGQLMWLLGAPGSVLLWMGEGVKQQAIITITAALVTFSLCAALVPNFGALGAAVSTASGLCLAGFGFLVMGEKFRRRQVSIAASAGKGLG